MATREENIRYIQEHNVPGELAQAGDVTLLPLDKPLEELSDHTLQLIADTMKEARIRLLEGRVQDLEGRTLELREDLKGVGFVILDIAETLLNQNSHEYGFLRQIGSALAADRPGDDHGNLGEPKWRATQINWPKDEAE